MKEKTLKQIKEQNQWKVEQYEKVKHTGDWNSTKKQKNGAKGKKKQKEY